METLTFTCKIITPMFLAGADGQTPELRAASIKGALRFWWRACNGHLGLEEMRRRETEIFGGVGVKDEGKRSRVTIRTIIQEPLQVKQSDLVPHKPFMKGNAFVIGQDFTVVLAISSDTITTNDRGREVSLMTIDQLSKLYQTVCLLGGIGKRSRRGMGSVNITEIRRNGEEPVSYKVPDTIEQIHSMLKQVGGGDFELVNGIIYSRFNKNENYPYIKQIQLGRPDNNTLKKVSQATHDLHQQDEATRRFVYGASLGTARNGRFASPVYVSNLSTGKGLTPIITTLNTVPAPGNQAKIDANLQEDFRKRIL